MVSKREIPIPRRELNPDRPARSQSLYRPSCPSHHNTTRRHNPEDLDLRSIIDLYTQLMNLKARRRMWGLERDRATCFSHLNRFAVNRILDKSVSCWIGPKPYLFLQEVDRTRTSSGEQKAQKNFNIFVVGTGITQWYSTGLWAG
jgi:hypothetical protein